jgi:hypothetical protein
MPNSVEQTFEMLNMKMKAIFNEARPRAESNLLYFDANFKT